jgi:hypothetical protein
VSGVSKNNVFFEAQRAAPQIPIYRDAPWAQRSSHTDLTFKINLSEGFITKIGCET